jgi:hypothetical protein
MSELWLVRQIFKEEPNFDFRMTERHHTPPVKLQHSRIGSCPSGGSAERGPLPGLPDLQV